MTAPRGTTARGAVRGTAPPLAWVAIGLLALPVVVDGGATDPYLPARWTVAGWLTLAGLALVGRQELRTRRGGVRRPGGRAGGSPPVGGPGRPVGGIEPVVAAAWLAVIAAAALAASLAPLPAESWWGDPARRGGVVSVALVAGAYRVARHAATARDTILRATPVVTAGLVAAAGRHHLVTPAGTPLDAVVGNAGQFGLYLVALVGCCLVVATTDPDRRWRWAGGLAAAGGVLALGATGSVAAIVGAAVLGGTWVLGGVWPARGRTARAAVAVAVPVAGLALVAAWPAGARSAAVSAQGRLDTWRTTWDAVVARPWTGWGPDGLRHGFARHSSPEFVATYGDDRITDRAHSMLLEPLAAGGVVLTLALALLLWVLVVHRDRDPLVVGITRALAAVGVVLLAWFPSVDVAVVIAVLFGLTGRPPATATLGPDRAAAPAVRPGGRTSAAGRTAGVVSLLAVASGAAASAIVGVEGMVADRELTATLAEVRAGQAPATAVHGPPRAQGLHQLLAVSPTLRIHGDPAELVALAVLVDDPRDAERRLLAADLLAAAGARGADAVRLEAAADRYREVLALSEQHSSAWLGLGRVLERRHDPEAGAALERAVRLRPRDVAPALALARLAHREGDQVQLRRWVQEACRRDAQHPQVTAALARLPLAPPPRDCRRG